VADIIRQYGTRFIEAHRAWLTVQHLRVLRAIAHYRTAALGVHKRQRLRSNGSIESDPAKQPDSFVEHSCAESLSIAS
jgi:hypothetical protein